MDDVAMSRALVPEAGISMGEGVITKPVLQVAAGEQWSVLVTSLRTQKRRWLDAIAAAVVGRGSGCYRNLPIKL